MAGKLWMPKYPEGKSLEASDVTCSEVKALFSVVGKTCCACAAGSIEKAVKRLPGIREAVVDVSNNTAHVLYYPSFVTDDKIRETIEDAGFKAKLINQETNEKSRQECRITINGMPSTSGSSTVESALDGDGVQTAQVTIATEGAPIHYDPNIMCSNQLLETVENTGFEKLRIADEAETATVNCLQVVPFALAYLSNFCNSIFHSHTAGTHFQMEFKAELNQNQPTSFRQKDILVGTLQHESMEVQKDALFHLYGQESPVPDYWVQYTDRHPTLSFLRILVVKNKYGAFRLVATEGSSQTLAGWCIANKGKFAYLSDKNTWIYTSEFVGFMRDILNSILEVRKTGDCHGDVRPDNIFIVGSEAKLGPPDPFRSNICNDDDLVAFVNMLDTHKELLCVHGQLEELGRILDGKSSPIDPAYPKWHENNINAALKHTFFLTEKEISDYWVLLGINLCSIYDESRKKKAQRRKLWWPLRDKVLQFIPGQTWVARALQLQGTRYYDALFYTKQKPSTKPLYTNAPLAFARYARNFRAHKRSWEKHSDIVHQFEALNPNYLSILHEISVGTGLF